MMTGQMDLFGCWLHNTKPHNFVKTSAGRAVKIRDEW